MAEYKYMLAFIVFFAVFILVLLGTTTSNWDDAGFSAVSFVLGAFTSILSGWIGMRIAVYANGRTAIGAAHSYARGFVTAFRGGIVMGFGLSTVGLFMLFIGILLIQMYYDRQVIPASILAGGGYNHNRVRLFGAISAYGLGGSSIAMFGRVGGGIFTKAADVGADLVGKVEQNIPEDDPRNPGVIADCIGDNVGDIAGMGSDLFGSFAEATCAALVISSTNFCLSGQWASMMFPLLISAVGILVCVLTSFVATNLRPAREKDQIETVLKHQLLISTVLATGAVAAVSLLALPSSFTMYFMNGGAYKVTNWGCFIAVAMGLWSGLGIGYTTEYFTSNAYKPVQEVAEACTTGAATNIIYGLALGYKSVIVPTFLIAITIYVAYNFASVFGIALGALGILSTMSIGLTIDAYGPISDNAGGIAEMSGMGKNVRDRTDALDAAGNTTAAIGKGYAIGSAALVGLALYGAFLTRAFGNETAVQGVAVSVNVIDPRVFFGLVIGAMIPYWFSALTMKSVGIAAMAMVREIQNQFRTIEGLMEGTAKPNYRACVRIATDASLREMLLPGALVVISPIFFGVFFGPEALAGLLPGSLVSGVQMAISASNTGGAWDNAKKYVEFGHYGGKGSDVHHAAIIGDTVGDPLKDTSGPALNIVVKLMAIISVVVAPAISNGSALNGLIFDRALKNSWAIRDTAIAVAP
jgi:inorganic pyrophosphatase